MTHISAACGQVCGACSPLPSHDLGPAEVGAAGEAFVELWSGTLLRGFAEGMWEVGEVVCGFAHFFKCCVSNQPYCGD